MEISLPHRVPELVVESVSVYLERPSVAAATRKREVSVTQVRAHEVSRGKVARKEDQAVRRV